jgi:monoamine oxidase
MSRGTPKIAVVGGGIAGLNAAYQLKKAGFIATVYEARRRLGGRILSRKGAIGEGLVTDLGGSFINTDHEDMLALVSDFGIKLFNRIEDAELLPFPKTGYFFDGQSRTEEEVAQNLRPLARQISRDADLIDRNFDRFAPPLDRMSVKEYLDLHADKIPEPFIRTLVENGIRTEYGVEPEESSGLQLIFNLPTVQGKKVDLLGNSDETYVMKRGSSRIIDSLSQALAGQIRTRMYLEKIQAVGDGFHLFFSHGHRVEADFVIMAIPFTVLRNVDLSLQLPNRLRRFINEVNLSVNEKIIAGFSEKVWRHSDGFVTEAWTDLGFSEVWEETQRQPGRDDGALTFYVGGSQVGPIQSETARFHGRKFIRRLEPFVPGAEAAATGNFLRTTWTKSPLAGGGYTTFRPGQLTLFGGFLWIESDDPAERQEVHVGNLVFAGEHLSDAFYGFMNGAAETGRLAAELVIRRIQEDAGIIQGSAKQTAGRASG